MYKYKERLEKIYLQSRDNECPPGCKYEFLGSQIFDFTTYDPFVDKLFAEKMLEVIDCILNRTTFEYQADERNYFNYLIMVNMPFLQGKLNWGTSIRGAWFDEYGHHSEKEEEKVYNMHYSDDLVIPKKDIKIFMDELLDWVKEKEPTAE